MRSTFLPKEPIHRNSGYGSAVLLLILAITNLCLYSFKYHLIIKLSETPKFHVLWWGQLMPCVTVACDFKEKGDQVKMSVANTNMFVSIVSMNEMCVLFADPKSCKVYRLFDYEFSKCMVYS